MNSSRLARSPSFKSQTGIPNRTFRADFLKLPSQDRYFGFVHGSTAPSSSDSVGSGITRFMSKSIVFPNPWQRGHAPNGELKLNRIGSGMLNSVPQVLHWNFSLNLSRSPPPAASNITSPPSRKQ